jgi:iron uptake system component EfeO
LSRTPVLALVPVLLAVGCASHESSGATGAVRVAVSDEGCALSDSSRPAGPVTFDISNKGSGKVTEVELLQGDRVLAEKENLAPGLDGSFTVQLQQGDYLLRCPGGSGPKDQPLTVTALSATAAAAPDAAEQQAATTGYAGYVRNQVADQVRATRLLTDAVRRGDLAAAARAYPAARVGYERIEPVAESFGDLDPELDARRADVADLATWTGYHRLEQAVFRDRSLAGMTAVADKLDADVARLQSLVAKETYTATDLANGASELLAEVASSKITGEEEAYSHIDLVDFAANVDGAEAAFSLLRPSLQKRDAALATSIAAAFAAVDNGLKGYRTGSGPTDFRSYTAVTAAGRHDLAARVDALAEPLSRVAAVLVSS